MSNTYLSSYMYNPLKIYQTCTMHMHSYYLWITKSIGVNSSCLIVSNTHRTLTAEQHCSQFFFAILGVCVFLYKVPIYTVFCDLFTPMANIKGKKLNLNISATEIIKKFNINLSFSMIKSISYFIWFDFFSYPPFFSSS